MEAIKKTLAATANVSMNREASLRRYFEDRPGRGSSLRSHLPPGLDKRGESRWPGGRIQGEGLVRMPRPNSEEVVRDGGLNRDSSPLVGEGGAATSPGQAVGAGTASPLRRQDRIVPEITNAIPGEVCWLCGKDATVVIGGLMWSYCEGCGANRLSLELAVAMWRVVKDTWAYKRGGP